MTCSKIAVFSLVVMCHSFATAQVSQSDELAKQEAQRTKLLATKTYFEMRQMNLDFLAVEQERKIEMRRRAIAARTASIADGPTIARTVPLQQFDRSTGHILWSGVLLKPEFQSHREQLNRLFSEHRVHYRPLSLAEVQAHTRPMREKLNSQFDKIAPLDWIASKNFIDNLERAIFSKLG